MSENLGLGKIIKTEQQRDAVHIAVVPIEAGVSLEPGRPIKVVGGKAFDALHGEHIGVVDPFLGETVRKGEKFWLFLNPGSITSLRHVWTHPGLPEEIPVDEVLVRTAKSILQTGEDSYQWLDRVARNNGMSYDELVNACDECLRYGYFTFDSDTTSSNLNEIREEIFDHLEAVSGRRFDRATRDNAYFSCSC